MVDIEITTETVYSITGLTFADMEMLCMGLDAIRGDLPQPMLNQNIKLTESIEYKLPECKSIPEIEELDGGSS